jgi:hypothetical protein
MHPYRTPPEPKGEPGHDHLGRTRAAILVILATCPLVVMLAREDRWILVSLLLAFVALVVAALFWPKPPRS